MECENPRSGYIGTQKIKITIIKKAAPSQEAPSITTWRSIIVTILKHSTTFAINVCMMKPSCVIFLYDYRSQLSLTIVGCDIVISNFLAYCPQKQCYISPLWAPTWEKLWTRHLVRGILSFSFLLICVSDLLSLMKKQIVNCNWRYIKLKAS